MSKKEINPTCLVYTTDVGGIIKTGVAVEMVAARAGGSGINSLIVPATGSR